MQMQARTEHHRKAPQRRCVGCGEVGAAEAMVRLVVAPDGEVAVDLASGSFGRGAHMHPRPSCIREAAQRGLARSFKAPIRIKAEQLVAQLQEATDRRITGLIGSAIGAGVAVVGLEAVASCDRGAIALLIVATDAGSAAAHSDVVRQGTQEGWAIVWGDKLTLGSLVGRQEVAVLGVRSARIGAAITSARVVADSARSGAEVR